MEWPFHAPWRLFLWVSILLIVLHASIFRDPAMRTQFHQVPSIGNQLVQAINLHFHICIGQSLLLALINNGGMSFFLCRFFEKWMESCSVVKSGGSVMFIASDAPLFHRKRLQASSLCARIAFIMDGYLLIYFTLNAYYRLWLIPVTSLIILNTCCIMRFLRRNFKHIGDLSCFYPPLTLVHNPVGESSAS